VPKGTKHNGAQLKTSLFDVAAAGNKIYSFHISVILVPAVGVKINCLKGLNLETKVLRTWCVVLDISLNDR
jgi:hypothetical protein